jgi:hypothetical protein
MRGVPLTFGKKVKEAVDVKDAEKECKCNTAWWSRAAFFSKHPPTAALSQLDTPRNLIS